MWRDVWCPLCGLRYSDFRAEGQPGFPEAKTVALDRAKELAASGDYSRPARRSAVLGRMHEWKRAAWSDHVALCREAQGDEAVDSLDDEPPEG